MLNKKLCRKKINMTKQKNKEIHKNNLKYIIIDFIIFETM